MSKKIMVFKLKEKNFLENGTKIIFYRCRDKDLLALFYQENNFLIYHEISGPRGEIDFSEYF